MEGWWCWLPAARLFPSWTEYNLMLGVSGAPNRDKSAGPIWFYKGENVAFDGDATMPAGKTQKPDVPFAITIRNTEHPIAKGLPLIWMHSTDTLVGNLRGPGKNMVVLATAHSDADHGGTGRDEPVLLAVTYGKGRVFHTLLGRTADGNRLRRIPDRSAARRGMGRDGQSHRAHAHRFSA